MEELEILKENRRISAIREAHPSGLNYIKGVKIANVVFAIALFGILLFSTLNLVSENADTDDDLSYSSLYDGSYNEDTPIIQEKTIVSATAMGILTVVVPCVYFAITFFIIKIFENIAVIRVNTEFQTRLMAYEQLPADEDEIE